MSAGRIAFRDAGCWASGWIPETRKNSSDEHHADNAGAAMLKRALSTSGRRFAIQNEITRPSRATVSVPAAGPYNRTAVKTNASEIEIEIFEPGNSTDAEPLTRVIRARRSQRLPMGN